MKLKVLFVTLLVAVAPMLAARPASAMTCAPDLNTVCSVVATVVCGVVAKGRPCLA